MSSSGCSSAPTPDGCLLTCKALTSSAACDDLANDYFDCEETATIQCNGQGDPYAVGCGPKYLLAINCAVNENPNPAIVAPCGTYCDHIETAACANNGTHDECSTNCLWLGATGTGCDDEWSAYLTCANGVTMTCVLGYATAPGCLSEWQSYKACIDAAGGN